MERLRAIPGVQDAAVATSAPLDGLRERGVVVAPDLIADARVDVGIKHVDEHYFETLDIPVLSGRGIDSRDRPGSPPVAVVNQQLAARLNVPDPVGKMVDLSLSPYGSTQAILVRVQIAGVIRTERAGRLQDAEQPIDYVPMAQEPTLFMTLIVRAHQDASSVVPGIREAVRNLNRSLPIGPMITMRELKARSYLDATQSAWAVGVFALVAALLAAFGLYWVLAQAVTQQRREFGIRMALGAGPRQIVSSVLRSALPMIAVGLAIGVVGALALTGVLKSLLFQVSVLDPVAFVLACASMMLVGLLAVILPLTRAAGVDPAHEHHTGGAGAFADVPAVGHDWVRKLLVAAGRTAPDLTFDRQMTLYLGDVTVRLVYYGQSHTPGDTIISIPEENLVVTGGLFFPGQIPMLGAQGKPVPRGKVGDLPRRPGRRRSRTGSWSCAASWTAPTVARSSSPATASRR